MHFRALLLLAILTIGVTKAAPAQSRLVDYDFQVVVAGTKPGDAFLQTIRGDERKNNALNRLSIISESQFTYPEPESGCGPVALLNTLVWYEKYGLIDPLFRDADPYTYKRRLFAEIDRRLMDQAGVTRAELNGSRKMDIAVVLDATVREQSGGQLRIHSDYFAAPLHLQNLLQTMPHFRIGYVLGYPKHPQTGEMLRLHAMTLIRADRAGYVTLATWGDKYRGILRMRDGEQWFIPQSPEQAEIQIVGMQRFIPFQPKAAASP